MTNLTLRDMEQRDLPDVRALIHTSFEPYAGLMHPDLFRLYIDGLPPVDADIPRTFLAETGGAIVATARLYAPGTAQTPVGTPLPPDAAWVRAVAVHPDLAGRGIGRLMMGECERRAITQDARAVMLHTLNFMQRAIQMYEGLGYRRDPDWDIHADKYVDLPEPSGMVALAYRREMGEQPAGPVTML